MAYAVRSDRSGTAGFLDEIRQAIWSVNSNLPLAGVRTLEDIFDRSTARTSFKLVMLAVAVVIIGARKKPHRRSVRRCGNPSASDCAPAFAPTTQGQQATECQQRQAGRLGNRGDDVSASMEFSPV